MDLVVFHALGVDRLKCSQADMQGDLGDLDAPVAHLRQDVRGEVQARSGRGNRAAFVCIDGLVAFAIGRQIVAGDIRRQWHVADLFNLGTKIRNGVEAQGAFAELAASDDFGRETMICGALSPSEINLLSNSYFSSRSDQSFPKQRIVI